MVVHGLTKTYYVKQNALSNLQLMGIGLNKIFSMDESPYEDEFLQPLNALFTKKQEKIYAFYKELIDVPDLADLDKLFQVDSEADDSFSSACLCLTLNDVRFLYDFMLNFRDLFDSSKQSANILMEDLDHFIKSNKIFQNKKMQHALAMNHVDGMNEAENGHVQAPEQIIEYFFFYKDQKKSNKAAKKQLEIDQVGLSLSDKILQKNLKILLNEINDIGMLKWQVKGVNNILEIRRCILLNQEKINFNKQDGSQSYISELVFEQLIEKSIELKNSKTQMLAFIKNALDVYEKQKKINGQVREESLNSMIQKADYMNKVLIQSLKRERQRVDWLYKINIDLASFIKNTQFNDLIIWRFEDECMYLHMDITEKNTESEFWQQKIKEKQQWRDEFFKPFKELLPPSQLKIIELEEKDSPKKQSLESNRNALDGNPAFKFMLGKSSRQKIIKDPQLKK